MAEISLSAGFVTIVDDDDVAWLSSWKWGAHSNGKNIYAARKQQSDGASRSVLMHRQIMDCPTGLVVDHINGDTLDNRRSNLRVVTQGQNASARHDRVARGSSRYFGVYWHKSGRWSAQISSGYRDTRKTTWLGYYDDEREAAAAYNRAAVERSGEFARLNEL